MDRSAERQRAIELRGQGLTFSQIGLQIARSKSYVRNLLPPELRAAAHRPMKAERPPACLHCGTGVVSRPRGLCWNCYYTPGVKEQYGPLNKYGRRGVGNLTGRRPLPPEPTVARPGGPEKVAVLAERAARGFNLWHPDDVELSLPLS